MAEDTGAADPSMEEILASIRKIISDDAPPLVEGSAPAAAEEDVVELTQMVQENGSILDVSAMPEPAPMVEAAPPPPPPPAPPPPKPPVAPLPPGEPLTSEPAANSAASALSSLASTLEIERLSSSAMPGASMLGNGGRTLEDMVIELMRPLLKDWLDKNLPATVDRLVQKEIERIARRS